MKYFNNIVYGLLCASFGLGLILVVLSWITGNDAHELNQNTTLSLLLCWFWHEKFINPTNAEES